MDGENLIDEAVVSVYAGMELRGQSTQAVKDGKHFLTIGGNDGEGDVLTFVVSTSEGDHYLTQTDIFQANAMRGSMAQPVVLQLSDATDIDGLTADDVNAEYYQLDGRRIQGKPVRKGVYIRSTSGRLQGKNNHQKMFIKK